MFRKLLTISSIIFVIFSLNTKKIEASTTFEYYSPCKYVDVNGVFKAFSNCRISTGTLGVGGGGRFIVTFPNGSQIVVYIYPDGKATTNDIPSDVAIAGGNVVVATEEGEIFIFKNSNNY